MAKNKMEDVRDHLIATMEALRDTENPMDIERALAVAEVGKVLIESAKAETAHLKVIGDAVAEVTGSGFIAEGPRPQLPGARTQ